MERLILDPPLAPQQLVCVTLIALGHDYRAIGQLLGISEHTAAQHVKKAARKIPGDLDQRTKAICWARGATLDVLMGTSLKALVVDEARKAPMLPLLPGLVASGSGSSE